MSLENTSLFNHLIIASGTCQQEFWADLGLFGPNYFNSADTNTPAIELGKQVRLGYLNFWSKTKDLWFEVRPNLPTKSAGNTTDTVMRGFGYVPSPDARESDFYKYDSISTLAPIIKDGCTGVERLWLRVGSGTGTVGEWFLTLNYTLI